MNTPPVGPGRRITVWAQRKKQKLRHLPQYLIGGVLHLISHWLKLHPKTLPLLRRALELGNPTATIWPSETIPMTSRLLAGGFWNYSFFQFHRHFFFPYWALRQYNPAEKSFIPRSHNVLSLNQTQRNWVSISFPGKPHEVSVDMAGAIMPEFDGFTIEFAALDEGKVVRPHDNSDEVEIEVPSPSEMVIRWKGRVIRVEARQDGMRLRAGGKKNLIISLRPFNMEGPALLYKLNYSPEKAEIGGDVSIQLKTLPQVWQLSTLETGDALAQIPALAKKKHAAREKKKPFYRLRRKKIGELRTAVRDPLGLATASFLYNSADEIDWYFIDTKKYYPPVGLVEGIAPNKKNNYPAGVLWDKWFPCTLELDIPEPYRSWFDYSKRHIQTLWDYDSITPGSFTYHHFWVRDAVLMLNALLLLGAHQAVLPVLKRFPSMVKRNGLFRSQAGEWDANGQALWILGRYAKVTGDDSLIVAQRKSIRRLIGWIDRMLKKHGGVLPPGFSAEHLGVADWYLWDNFWALGGLREMLPYKKILRLEIAAIYGRLHRALLKYLHDYDYYPAALGRGRDAGMIGSIAALYPLNLPEYNNSKMSKTLNILRRDYFFRGGFFQENIHSGINPYLTLQVAGGFLLQGNPDEAWAIMKKILGWAQKAYTFPEAVHPKTRGGCMGDGFHGWAYAETVAIFRNLFYLEMPAVDILFAGTPASWFKIGFRVRYLATAAGMLEISARDDKVTISGLIPGKEILIQLPKGRRLRDFQGIAGRVLPVSQLAIGRPEETEYELYRIKAEFEQVVFSIT